MALIRLPNELERQTRIRLDLLKNGYRPLPTAEKVAFMKGWPTMLVNDRVIRGWPMMGPNTKPAITTAIQLEGTMLAIDVDVQNAEVSREIEDLMATVFGEEVDDAMPFRTSGSNKFMALVRTDNPYGMWKTPKYMDESGADQMVEIYGGASTRYFSCYGPHTIDGVIDGQYNVVKSYEWHGVDPTKVGPDDLPLITEDQLNTFMMKADDILASQGWEKVKGSKGGSYEAGVVYDLNEDMIFETKDGSFGYFQAIAYAQTETDARCSDSFLGEHGNNTLSKCRMSAVGSINDDDGLALGIFNHETWTQHYPAEWAPRTPEERSELVSSLGSAVMSLMPAEVEKNLTEAEEAGANVAAFEEAISYLLETLAYDNVTGSVHYMDNRDLIWHHVSISTVKGAYAHLDLTWEGPRGGQRRYSAVDAWRAYDSKIKVSGVRFNARTDERVVGADKDAYANGFFGLPAANTPDPDVQDIVTRFIEHLIPNKEEREWFLDWLADKYHRPWVRNCAVLFVAPGIQGAGRGTLFRILDTVFDKYTSPVREKDLLDSRFNSFMENNLLLFCNELGGMGWGERKRGYETLKDMVDPSHSTVLIEHKGIKAYRTVTYTSFILATNQPGALTMDAEDRRFAIITNTTKLQGGLLNDILDAGYDDMADALRAMLISREVTNNVSDAPMFAGREAMLAANDTDLDEVIRAVVSKAGPDRSWVRSDFEKTIKMEIGGSTKTKVPGLRQAVSQLVGRRAERMGVELLPEKLKIGNSSVSLLSKNPDYVRSLHPEARAVLCTGGSEEAIACVNIHDK